LDDVGREQARTAAGVLAAWLGGRDGVTVVSSDLLRASETAGLLADRLGVEVQLDKRLREIDVGRWQGLSRAAIVAAGMGAELDLWFQDDQDGAAGGAERRGEAGLRGAEAVRERAEVVPDGGVLVVVSHGAILRATALTLLGLGVLRSRWLGVLRNCHWAELTPSTPTWRMLAYNVGVEPGSEPSAW
jgi:probable phosphoglycerate mutase